MAQVIPLFENSSFDPETVERLSVAFEEAWHSIEKSSQPGRIDAAHEILAKHIVELAQRGERDTVRLCDSAVELFASIYGADTRTRHYRVYAMTDSNHVAGPPTIISCKSDQEAIEHAKQMLGPYDIEIWDGARCVIRLGRQEKNEASR